jgi:hypothetical protein
MMQIRDDRQAQRRRLVRAGRRLAQRPSTRSLTLALLLALMLAACLAPTGQARSSGGSSGQEAGAAASARAEERAAARDQRIAARKDRLEAERAARARARIESGAAGSKAFSNERDNGVVSFGCNQLTVTYRGFPQHSQTNVTELLRIDGLHSSSQFSFTETGSAHTIPVVTPPGTYQIDVFSKWNTNGHRGAFDIHGKATCSGVAFSIEKLQKIEGAYATSPLIGRVGQTVDYEIVVKNTGYLPLSFEFTDVRCDAGTITGGPGSTPVASGASSVYLCSHLLSAADLAVGSYTNTATDRGAPPPGQGSPVTHTSTPVVVNLTTAPLEEKSPPTGEKGPPTEEKITPTEDKKSSPGENKVSPSSGTLAASSTSPLPSPLTPVPQSGVLAFAARTVPALRGPGGCMRGRFAASLRSTGVRSVTFYMDGHKLKTLTARNARKGQLTITVDASKLRVGAHKLLAKITMLPSASAAKSGHASRALTFVRCRSATIDPKFTG